MHFEFAYFFFFLIQLELKRQLGSYIPVVISSKIISDSRQKWANIYPFLDQNDAKTLPFGAPHTQMAYVRVNPPPPPIPREHGLGVNGLKEPKQFLHVSCRFKIGTSFPRA